MHNTNKFNTQKYDK